MKTTHRGFKASGWPVEVAMSVLIQGAEYVFEQRPDDPKIGAAGTLAAYGGKIEWGELADEAALRELAEGTNLRLRSQDLRRLGMVCVKSDFNGGVIDVSAHTFEALLSYDATVKERGGGGKPIGLFHDQVISRLQEFSPATRKILKTKYLNTDQGESHGVINY